MAMACMTMQGDDNYTVEFSAADFATAIGQNINDLGSKSKKVLLDAVSECAKSIIKINMPDGTWEAYAWFVHSSLSKFNSDKWNWHNAKIKMTFNYKLADILKEFKKAYSKITLVDLGKLQSSYAIRYYETAMSSSGLAGKRGNKRGEWFFELSIDMIRELFDIDAAKYKLTSNFRTFVIDEPLDDLNAADIGLQIEAKYAREGKRLVGARFNCRLATPGKQAPIPRKRAKAPELTQEERYKIYLDYLIANYKDEFDALVNDITKNRMATTTGRLSKSLPSYHKSAATEEAVKILSEKYADELKKLTEPIKRPRGRPRKNPVV
jgi:plasmid replication initiation protein